MISHKIGLIIVQYCIMDLVMVVMYQRQKVARYGLPSLYTYKT